MHARRLRKTVRRDSKGQARWMAEAGACLRLVRYSGSAGEVCSLDTDGVSVRAKRQREAAAIVDAVYALRRPVLAMYTAV